MSNNQKQIRFENFPDLQSRLVLLPYNDTDGTGAAVASYTPKVIDVTGYVLTNIKGLGLDHSDQTNWLLHTEFNEILSLLRDAPTPIVLTLMHMPEHTGTDSTNVVPLITVPSSEETDDDDDEEEQPETKTINNHSTAPSSTSHGNTNPVSSVVTTKAPMENTEEPKLKNRFIKWGTMVGKATNKLAHATNAAVNATADVVHDVMSEKKTPPRKAPKPSAPPKTAAPRDLFSPISTISSAAPVTVKPVESITTATTVVAPTHNVIHPTLEEKAPSPRNDSNLPLFGMFLQSTKDGYVPLDGSRPTMNVNNSSLLTIRYNVNQSQSMRDLKFQWFRSTYPVNDPRFQHEFMTWNALSGATRAMYQPSITDGGYQLKCEIIDDNSTHECILRRPVESDGIILIAAQKNLEGGGVSFESLLGCGKAEGKILRITIEKGPNKEGKVASNLFIYQVSGNRDKLLHDVNEPICHATAEADASKPNIFYLIVPEDLPTSASIVKSLCTQNRLELYAEDRVTRETFLTTLGLANYDGSVSVTSTLFPVSTVEPTQQQQVVNDTITLEDNSNAEIMCKDVSAAVENVETISTFEETQSSPAVDLLSGPDDVDGLGGDAEATAVSDNTMDTILDPPIIVENAHVDDFVPSSDQIDWTSNDSLVQLTSSAEPVIPTPADETTSFDILSLDEQIAPPASSDFVSPIEMNDMLATSHVESYEEQGDLAPQRDVFSSAISIDFLGEMSNTSDGNNLLDIDQPEKLSEASELESVAMETLEASSLQEISPTATAQDPSVTSKIETDLLRNQFEEANQLIAELQRRLNDSEQIVKLKDDELSIVKKEAVEENRKFYETQQALQASETRINTMDEDTMKMRKDFLSRISSLEKELKAKQESSLEHEKIMRSWQNEKSVLTAAIEAREGKLGRLAELQSQVAELDKITEERDSLRFELSTAKYQVTEASTSLMESQALLSETQSSFEQVKANVDELNAKFEEVNSKCTTLEAESNSIQEKYQTVKAERNTLKQKNESLAKDMARIRKTGMEISDIERIIQENADLHAQVELLKAQQSHLVGDLEHSPSKEDEMENSNDDSGESSGPSAEELRRAWEQKTELERMVKELTEYVNAKQSQLDTMKDVNRQLTEELQNVARSRRAPLKPFFDKDAKASADTDKNLKLMQGQNNTEALTKVIEERDSLKIELESVKAQAAKYQSELNDAEIRVSEYQASCNKLQQEVDSLTKQLKEGSVKSLTNEKAIDNLQTKYDLLVQTQGNLTESQAICLKLQQQAYDLTQQLQEEKGKLAMTEKDMEKLRYQSMTLENERNILNNKLHAQSRDLSRILRDGLAVDDLERMINDYTAINAELATVKAQRKTLSEEVTSLTQKLAVSTASAGPAAKTPAGDALRNALLQKFELERVVKELTEYVNAKEMQIETLKTINRALTQELQTLRKH